MIEGILVITIIAILYYYNRKQPEAESMTVGEVTTVAPKHAPGCRCASCIMSPESAATRENAEYFDSEAADKPAEDDGISYNKGEFMPGMDYKDYAAHQAVDAQVIKNHAEFVKDRLGDNSQNVTGRTWSPDSNTADQAVWVGIRGRPQAVPVSGYSSQVPDMNLDWFAKKQAFTWNSS